jgi:carbon-monoxide dehydrogenase medium subunit
MQEFRFHRPSSTGEALELVRRAKEGRFLAGGQSLIPLLKLDLAQPSDLVSLAAIADLRFIRPERDALEIGAATTHTDVARSADVARAIPALAQLAASIGDPQVRNRGTLGGSLAHADPAADYPAALLGLGATVRTDRREIGADDFFRGPYETALEPGELILAVRFPVPEKAAYAKFPQPASRFALAGVFVAGAGGRGGAGVVRVAVTGASARPFRAVEFEQALGRSFAGVALQGLAVPSDGLTDNLDASADYRAHLVGVMVRRAVAACG